MGVSIDIWRARIGFYRGSVQLNAKEMHAIFLDATNVKYFMAVLAMSLIVGNVEPNPGPPFKCPQESCSFTSPDISRIAYHQQIHRAQKNFNFRCPIVLCKHKLFTTYSGLTNHINDLHSARKSPQTTIVAAQSSCKITTCDFSCATRSELCHYLIQHLQKNTVLKCPLCRRSGNFSDAGKLLSHLNQTHSDNAFKEVKCNFLGCSESISTFDKVYGHLRIHLAENVKVNCPLQKSCHVSMFSDVQTFRTHLSVKHIGWKDDGSPILQQAATQVESASTSAQATSTFMASSINVDDCTHFEPGDLPDEDNSNEDPITTDMFFGHIGQFYLVLLSEQLLPDSTVDSIAKGLKLMSELVQHQFGVAITRELKQGNIKQEEVIDIINSVMSCDVFYAAHHRKSPGPTFTSVHLRKNFIDSLNYVKPIQVRLDNDVDDGAFAHLVPPSDVLEILLEDPSIQEHVDKSFQGLSDPDVIQDYTDESACRCKGERERIDIHVFQDAFNTVNPIGSAKNKHKFNGTYWSIGNLPQHIRSKVDSKNLAYLVQKKYLQDTRNYGPRKSFKPVVDRFKKLEAEGIVYKGRSIPVVVQFYCGDSLGGHEIGGFIGQFSSTYFCRFCEIKRLEFLRNPCAMRAFCTRESYYAALQQLEEIQSRRADVVTFRGVKEDSVLHNLEDFHVCDKRLPPCVAHDVFENGVADHDLSEMLFRLVGAGWFSYPDLNKLLGAFKCLGPDKTNKPAPIKDTGTKLGGHAIQNWTRLLPFIIQDCIQDPSHEIWKLYLKLNQMLEYACAPSFRREDLGKLKEVSEDYMRERHRLLEKKVKPKHHFLMHYADLIPFVGPIIHLFTMRFEAKHQYFKRVARACKNFINLGKTLAHLHQIWMAYLTAGSVLSRGCIVKKSLPMNVEMYDAKVKEILNSGIFSDSSVNCSKIEIDGLGYKKGMASLWEDYGVYQIEDEPFDSQCVLQSQLKYPVEQAVYNLKDKLCFSLKHFIH
ncbi:hypothetical protein ONE63_011392 [Megalurothrips usitatus]|uniref:C2H2-type domain-containing protein n=1 Tax=Megalurothrips usitatus TaxID=439358 RepID=A0AAV7X5U9_9NEOP|nr:hypothetical protein ONE63_011392 [Megalurothrips usitatus]